MKSTGESFEIVRSIITLAHSLGKHVIAEGVETGEQLELLRSLGCEYGQGYFFSKPLDAESARRVIVEAPKW
jgi:EAL domain-containing protein (putative c-di-GMP-specific phosphodiesterase class I)